MVGDKERREVKATLRELRKSAPDKVIRQTLNEEARKERRAIYKGKGQPRMNIQRDYFIWSVVVVEAITAALACPVARKSRKLNIKAAIDAVYKRKFRFGMLTFLPGDKKGRNPRVMKEMDSPAGIKTAFYRIADRINGAPRPKWAERSSDEYIAACIAEGDSEQRARERNDERLEWLTKWNASGWERFACDLAEAIGIPSPTDRAINAWPSLFLADLLRAQSLGKGDMRFKADGRAETFGPLHLYVFQLGNWKLSAAQIEAVRAECLPARPWGFVFGMADYNRGLREGKEAPELPVDRWLGLG